MSGESIHNPDRFMVDLRQIISQGRKRIGLLVGAGAPVSITVDDQGRVSDNGNPLIPDVARLTAAVRADLDAKDAAVVETLSVDLGDNPNIEAILTRVRRLAQAIGNAKVHGLDGPEYEQLAERICAKIGVMVAATLPDGQTPYTELVAWLGGTQREHPVEIFTPNYDFLFDEAFERARIPYFDGFAGAHKPFFDPTSIADDRLPARWARLWKIHGSLGWEVQGDLIFRTGSREATNLIYPDHLKYDHINRQPYSALFERLRNFLATPDSLLICTGFSFGDAHICALIDEALAANTHTAVLAFQYRTLDEEKAAVQIALRRPNLSVYARDGAVIFGIRGKWRPGEPPTGEWTSIRRTFWKFGGESGQGEFLLGDFAKLARFFALSQANQLESESVNAPVVVPPTEAAKDLIETDGIG